MAEDRPRSREVSEAAAADLARAGGRDATVEIVEHHPAWAARFTAERERLAPLLGDAEIHHIGSTAVPGLAAKPVIDLMALVGDVDAPVQTLVQRGGYVFPEAFNATLRDPPLAVPPQRRAPHAPPAPGGTARGAGAPPALP